VKGAVLWRTGVRQVIRGKPCINGRTLTVGAQQGTIYVLDSESGRITDEYRGEGEINSGLNLYRDLMIVAYKNGRVVAYNADTMKPRWRFSCKGIISTRPVIRDGYIFFGAWDDTFYVLRAEDGDLLWESYVGENVSRDFLVFDREIILFFPKGEILSLGRSDGRIDWVKYYGSTEFNFNYFQGIDKFFIFVPELIALDPDDGTVAFNYRERAFFFYKEMLFENMIEGKVRLNDEDRSRLLSEVYFTISSYPLLPPQTAGEEIVYFVADDSFFYVYNLEKDFFIVKYKLV
jgi:outer membrane protein assembly factor BamB